MRTSSQRVRIPWSWNPPWQPAAPQARAEPRTIGISYSLLERQWRWLPALASPKNYCVYLSKIIPCVPPRGLWLLGAKIPCEMRRLGSHRTAPLGPQRRASALGPVGLLGAFCGGSKREAPFTGLLFSDQEKHTDLSCGVAPSPSLPFFSLSFSPFRIKPLLETVGRLVNHSCLYKF